MVKISANRMDMETKRLDRPQIRNYSETVVAVIAASTATLDISAGNIFEIKGSNKGQIKGSGAF